jgi:hypothetical protein
MARYVLVGSVAGAVPNGQYTTYGTGTKIADSAGNAQAGDLVWPALANNPNPAMAALDASALALILRNAPSDSGNWIKNIVPG